MTYLETDIAGRSAGRPRVLLLADLFMGLFALAGGLLLIDGDLGMPSSELDGTPFDGFLWPGLILSFVVGGSLLAAALMIWIRAPRAAEVCVAASLILLVWIAVEGAMISGGRPLQVAVAAYGLMLVVLSWRFRRWHRHSHLKPATTL